MVFWRVLFFFFLSYFLSFWLTSSLSLSLPLFFGVCFCFVLLQDYILAIPDDRYTPDFLKAKPLDKSPDFIAQCGGESFQIEYEHNAAQHSQARLAFDTLHHT